MAKGGTKISVQLPDSRLIYLGEEINDDTAEKVISSLFSMNLSSQKDPIHVIINSYGGYVDQMFAIYDVMKACDAPIYTMGIGKAMSAATLLLAAGKNGHRRVSKRTRIMLHEIWNIVGGPLSYLKDDIKEMERLQAAMVDALAKETKLTKTKINKMMGYEKETIFSADEAVEAGIVDIII